MKINGYEIKPGASLHGVNLKGAIVDATILDPTVTQKEKLLKLIQDTIDDWTNEAIYDFNLNDVVEYETAKKLILFGAHTIASIAYEIDND